MSNPSVLTISLPAAVTNGIAQSQSPGTAALTLNGSLVASGVANLVTAQRVVITSGSNDTGITFAIVGTDRYGNAQTESLAGASGAAATGVKDFLTVSSITPSAAVAGTVFAGTNAVGSSEWVLDNFLAPAWYLTVAVSVSGTINYTVEHIYIDPNTQPAALQQYGMTPGAAVPPTLFSLTALAAKAANAEATYANQPIMAHRITQNSGTGAATMYSIQGGIGDP